MSKFKDAINSAEDAEGSDWHYECAPAARVNFAKLSYRILFLEVFSFSVISVLNAVP